MTRLLTVLLVTCACASSLQAQLPPAVRAIIEKQPVARAHWGIAVSNVVTGEVLVSHNADRLFIPASNTKLVVASAAAHYLAPDFRYTTTLYATGAVSDSVLRGDVILYGRGDPTLSGRYEDSMTSIWAALADSLRARGINAIAGRVMADESHWDTDYVRGDWESYDLLWWYAAPVSALGFNDNSIDFSTGPGAPGEPARITWQPQTGFFTLVNRSRTVPTGRPNTLDFTRVAGTDTIVAYGEIPADAARRTEYVAVVDPARYAATVFSETLAREGIRVGVDAVTVLRDSSASATARRGARVLVEHRSPTLPRILGPVLQSSQNWFAEQLLKTIGREAGAGGSWAEGLRLERRFLIDVVGIDSSAFRLRDASGLSAHNLMTPHAFVQLLRHMALMPRMEPALAALPVSGAATGSLRTRLTDLSGRVAAKTGSIGNVDALSGLLRTGSGRYVAFSIVANNTGLSSAAMRPVLDDIVRALSAAY